MANVTTLDPVEGLVQYVLDIKPYHTKIIEVLVEYVQEEIVDVRIVEDPQIEVLINKPSVDPIPFGCSDGYATLPFGGPGLWPVISPNPNTSFEDYPAINAFTNSFTVPGDLAQDFRPGDQIELITFVEDYSDMYNIVSVSSVPTGSPPTVNGQFVIEDPLNNFATNHPQFGDPGYHPVYTAGMGNEDNKPFSIINILPNTPSVGFTTVEVGQNITSLAGGQLGLIKTAGNNTGTYTVISAIYNGGSIDQWPGYPNTGFPDYIVGDDPHTIVTVQENLLAPNSDPANDVFYFAAIRTPGIQVEKVLSYSNFVAEYIASPPDFSQTPDEGLLTTEIIQAVQSTLYTSGSPIGTAIPDTGKFVVPYNLDVSNVFVGMQLRVRNSTANNGIYTITSVSYDMLSGNTTIGVEEQVVSNIGDGTLEIDIPSNVFIVDGNFVNRFPQGKEFEINGGTFAGKYTTLYADFVGGKTRIRVTRDIVTGTNGFDLLDIDGGFLVRGDKTGTFVPGTQFNVVGTELNDGSFTVDTSTYVGFGGSPLTFLNYTVIVPQENFTDQPNEGGYVVPVQHGTIKEMLSGFGNSGSICEITPEGLVRVKFHENITFDGLGLDLSDDIIAYNLENTDNKPYQVPLETIFSSTSPTIVGIVTGSPTSPPVSPPSSPSLNELWYNGATTGVPGVTDHPLTLHRWAGYGWKPIKTAWWLDTDTDLLYYRTVNHSIDTGWILYLAEPPGFSLAQPAVSGTVKTGEETFYVDPGQSTFSFNTTTEPVVNVQQETVSAPGFFTVDGNLLTDMQGSNLTVGERQIEISGSTGSPNNDGIYDVLDVVYDSINDQTSIVVSNNIPVNAVSGDLTFLPLIIPGEDKTLVKVAINGVPANFTVDSETQITLLPSPDWNTGDTITIETFRRGGVETNADVQSFDAVPHSVFHSGVTVDTLASAYVVPGGNYMNKFTPDTVFNVWNTGSSTLSGSPPTPQLATHRATTFPIVDVDDQNYTITIDGDWTELFIPDRVFKVQLSTNEQTFVVTSSVAIGSLAQTVVTVDQVVTETPAESPTDLFQTFFNPGLPVFTIDNVTDTIIVSGEIVDRYPTGTKVAITNSTTANRSVYTVTSASYDSVNDRTNIFVAENIPDPEPASTGGATISIAIDQNYTKDLGVVIGAVYDPVVISGGSPQDDQVRTYVVPNTTPVPTTSTLGISYTWIGPLRIDTAMEFTNVLDTSFTDGLGASNELLGVPDRYIIIDTDATTNTFLIGYNDPLTGDPVNLTDSFTPGTTFTVAGSFSGSEPGNNEENNIEYTVTSSTYNPITGNTEIVVQENITHDETTVAPDSWTHGYIIREAFVVGKQPEGTAATEFTEDLDFGWGGEYEWQIIDVDAGTNTVTVSGDVTTILYAVDTGSPADPNDQVSIVGSNSGTNDGVYDIISYVYDPLTMTTTIELSPSINTTPAGQHGVLRIENIDITNWFQYLIKEAKPLRGSPPTAVDVFEVWGNAAGTLQQGEQFRVLGTSNDGVYQITGPVIYNPISNTTDVPVNSIAVTEAGGWIESHRDYGIRLVFEDNISTSVTEDARGALLLSAGNLVDAWDYTYWNLGSWDESLGQTIFLYTNET